MPQLSSRLQAGLLHLGGSIAIAIAVICVVYLRWYPEPFASLQGVGSVLPILVVVDMSLGPVITTFIANPIKSRNELALDIGLIVLIQIVALAYGVSTIYEGRPTYVVFAVDRFEVVAYNEIVRDSLERADFSIIPPPDLLGFAVVGSSMPLAPEEREKILTSSLNGGADLAQMPEYFVPFDSQKATAATRAHPARLLADEPMDPQRRDTLLELLEDHANLGFLPLMGTSRDGVVLLDRTTGNIVRMMDIAPQWQSR